MQTTHPTDSNVFNKLHTELNCFTSIVHILEKLEQDKDLMKITKLFSNLFNSEICYAIKGLLNRAKTYR